MKRTTGILMGFVLASLFTGIACKPRAPKTTEEARPSPAPAMTASPSPSLTPAPRPEDILAQDLAELNRRGYLKDALYDYNDASLREEARSILASDAEWLKRYPSVQIVIEGHCDERGTSEYNLALGDRRANAAKEYLGSLGVAVSRIKTVSYGKERPLCSEAAESCWARNRRAHFVINAK